ncbi:hypothetical protein C8R45DRAFT_1100008 [Mycena sanguinolenta]|nr:hypothetical protein C8R45DRAFT_1100008 [Mycena sanguinolenta]
MSFNPEQLTLAYHQILYFWPMKTHLLSLSMLSIEGFLGLATIRFVFVMLLCDHWPLLVRPELSIPSFRRLTA